MSRILITFAVAALIVSCDSGTAPKETPEASSGGVDPTSARPSGTEVLATASSSTSASGTSARVSEAAKPEAAKPEAVKPEAVKPEAAKPAEKKEEPRYVTVQHILIGFRGSVPGKGITRTKEEAAALAADILKRAKAGEDFDKLVREYTDDSPPGIYRMSNHGVPPPPGAYSRGGMVAAFGDVGFPLDVGGIGMAAYDPRKSPYGWHIIKRKE